MAGFASDFAKRPVAQKVGIFVAIGVVLAGLYYQLAYKPLKADLDAAQAEAVSLQNADKKLRADEKEYKQLVEEQLVLSKIIEENDQALPTASQLPAFFDMLNRKIGESGVDVLRWDYLKELPLEGGIVKVPFEMELQGTFYELKRFFYLLYKVSQKEGDEREAAAPATPAPADVTDVQERDRILTIEDLTIGSPEVRNNELTLVAKFRASTFRKEVAVAPEPTPADKKKASKAKGKGAAADAKAKTEDAMDKSEDRAKAAGGADSVKGGL